MERVDEVAAALDYLREVADSADRQRLPAAIIRVRRTMIAFGAALSPGGSASSELIDAFCERLYPRLLRAYRAAGYPSGPDDEGMWQWLRQQAAIAAEAERVERERAWQRGLAMLRREIEQRRVERRAGASVEDGPQAAGEALEYSGQPSEIVSGSTGGEQGAEKLA